MSSQLSEFKGSSPLLRVTTKDDHAWSFYDKGPRHLVPLVFLPPLTGSPSCFFNQIDFLVSKGYRCLSINLSICWSHKEFSTAFDRLLEHLGLNEIHLYGVGLGGFLAQYYSCHYPKRVKSIVLESAFIDTKHFSGMTTVPMVLAHTPHILLKQLALTFFVCEAQSEGEKEAIEFYTSEIDEMPQSELASRISMHSMASEYAFMKSNKLGDQMITIIDSLKKNENAFYHPIASQLDVKFPEASKANLKKGGEFCHMSEKDEVNLFLQVHLRRHYPSVEGLDKDVNE